MKKKESKPKNQKGRPSLYDPLKHPKLARKYCLEGCTDEAIADKMEIARATLANWKNQYPEFLDAFKAKALVDHEVENSLLRSALGYFIEEEEVTGEYSLDGRLIGQTYKKKIHKKFIPASVMAQALWLRNRDSSWRNTEGSNTQKGLILEWIEKVKESDLNDSNSFAEAEK
jgi:hypothetical protein